jgi:hypothetical protein
MLSGTDVRMVCFLLLRLFLIPQGTRGIFSGIFTGCLGGKFTLVFSFSLRHLSSSPTIAKKSLLDSLWSQQVGKEPCWLQMQTPHLDVAYIPGKMFICQLVH